VLKYERKHFIAAKGSSFLFMKEGCLKKYFKDNEAIDVSRIPYEPWKY